MTANYLVPVLFRYSFSRGGRDATAQQVMNVTPWVTWSLLQRVRARLAEQEGTENLMVTSWERMEKPL